LRAGRCSPQRKGGNRSHWQTCDQRFRFLNLDALGKPGTIIARGDTVILTENGSNDSKITG
jgi:hypothetical protein